ncbi:MAG TPA: serine/threonine-protein kinase, partial [Candidatus Xenobia bacterium]
MLEPGETLQGRYTVDQILGQGGRGIVYLARQDLLGGRRVAIKETHFEFVMPEEQTEAVAQFQREARLLASLEHKNLVDVKDFFEENGNLYLVMDFVEGETLEEILERNNGSPANLDEVFLWADQICDVLDCLHRHKPPIIFRDLKPGNIMLDKNGNVRLIDFGIARVLEPDSRDLTERAGTVGYAPYEQHAGKTPDARTDIYALGATLYDL